MKEMENYLSSMTLKALTQRTITDKGVLMGQIEKIRSGAIAYCLRENDEHIIAMAAPLFDMHGRVVASITVPLPAVRFEKEKEEIIAPALREAVKTLSHWLAFQGRRRK